MRLLKTERCTPDSLKRFSRQALKVWFSARCQPNLFLLSTTRGPGVYHLSLTFRSLRPPKIQYFPV